MAGRVLITGGAGFVGSSLAERMAAADWHVTVLDNLSRRGSALNVPRLERRGINFHHGDVRLAPDRWDLPGFDLIIDCAAEPSVHAGTNTSPLSVSDVNLIGTLNTLEKAREDGSAFLFLSSSRVYSIAALRRIRLKTESDRFVPESDQEVPGVGPDGIDESFPCDTFRSFYGASKRAAELFIQEFAAFYGVRALINRCGLIAGPHQMARSDQGVVALWIARHIYGRPLTYTGYGGKGLQTRDVLHPDDLFALIERQLDTVESWEAQIYNVGGGPRLAVSLCELTSLCREVTGSSVPIGRDPETASVDIPYYVSDTEEVSRTYRWSPKRTVRETVKDISNWIGRHQDELADVLDLGKPD